jgi:hypothetical protein
MVQLSTPEKAERAQPVVLLMLVRVRSEVDPMLRTTGSGFLGGTAAVRVSQ